MAAGPPDGVPSLPTDESPVPPPDAAADSGAAGATPFDAPSVAFAPAAVSAPLVSAVAAAAEAVVDSGASAAGADALDDAAASALHAPHAVPHWPSDPPPPSPPPAAAAGPPEDGSAAEAAEAAGSPAEAAPGVEADRLLPSAVPAAVLPVGARAAPPSLPSAGPV